MEMSRLEQPLSGIRVVEATHAVMGPCSGYVLASLGAEVIHIEPVEGDPTRRLGGFGSGYFDFYNRSKRSVALNLKLEPGQKLARRLIESADIFVENFGPGTAGRLGIGPEELCELYPRLIYCSLKGFLSGPYETRHAMDEVVQMMGGLAYMTGPQGRPLRAGASVVDVTGGMFGVIGILAALEERRRTGKGKWVKSALYETTAFLVGQHMAHAAISGEPLAPMPDRVSAWAVYQLFESKEGSQVFIGIISDRHWVRFCEVFSLDGLLTDKKYESNNSRIENRGELIPYLERKLSTFKYEEIVERCEQASIPFAPVATPENLFRDPQLQPHLQVTTLKNGESAGLPTLPLEINGARLTDSSAPPQIGDDTIEVLKAVGVESSELGKLREQGVIG